ncbi:MAG TPA: SMI1/KNR4 family protein [Pyrinomonadaceae bacterium]
MMFGIGRARQQRWLSQGIKLRPGASEEELAAFETKHSVRLPEDMREYLTTIDGFDDSEHWMSDDQLITFLALDEIQPLNKYWSPTVHVGSDYFVFADCSLSVHVYAIRLASDSAGATDVVVVYDPPRKVADSFSDFVRAYLDGKTEVLFPPPVADENANSRITV